MVQGKQILHETYSPNSNGQIEYNCINYVSGENYPVREIKKRTFYRKYMTKCQQN